jgi:ribonuclease E
MDRMKKEMLINVLQPEECRIAIIEDGVLEELYVERTSHESYVGNIYKGRIVNIEPSIQAAFVDFGVGRNGFLHVSDVEPAYYRHLEQRRSEGGGRRGGRDRDRDNDRDRDRGRRPHHQDRPGGRPAPRPSEPEMFPDEPHERELPLRATAETPAPPALPVAEAPPPPSPVEERAAETGDPTPVTEAAPQTSPEPTPTRGRRSRGGSRRRREEPAAAAPEEVTAESEPTSSETELPAPPSDEAKEPPRPRFMESAERRTEDDDEEERTPPEDADLFFPRTPVAEEPPAPVREEPPEVVQEEIVEDYEDTVTETVVAPAPSSEEELDSERHAEEMIDERMPDFDEDDDEEIQRPPRPRNGRRPHGDRGDRGRRGRPGRMGMGRPKPLIQDIFRRGQEVLVQVIKEGIGTKGPTLSTYISIPGRYMVLMPHLNRIGVSRKIADDEQRRRIRDVMRELHPPEGLGFVIRTAAMDRTKKELQRELAYLVRLWQVVVKRIRKLKAPAEIYQESDMITRYIRDTFTNDVDSIWVDEPVAFEHAQEFLQIVMPRYASRIKLYGEQEPLFHKYGIENEIGRIQQRHVPLPNGGSIVIEQTEALVAIDVNSGNFRADNNAEETAYQMNLLAAKEIARQLRLRDLGGVIVNDFIDMRDEKHKRGLEKAFRDSFKRDRARTKILKISQFGIIEMTRQRVRPSLKRSVYQDCPHCLGTGQVKTCESMSIDVMRMLQLAAHRSHVDHVAVRVADDVANYLQNKKRKEITQLEEVGKIAVQITGTPGAPPETLDFICYDNNNNEVKLLPHYEERPPRRR